MRTFLLCITLFVSPIAACGGEQSPDNKSHELIVFANVNIVDTRGGTIIPRRTVVIQGGRIAAIAKIGLIGDGRNIRVINAEGMYLMPGLWDMDVSTADRAALWNEKVIYPLFLANGVTGVRDMGSDPELLEQREKRIRAGETIGPNIERAAPFSLTREAAGSAEVHESIESRIVSKLKEGGTSLMTVPGNITRESYFAFAKESAKQNVQLVGPVPNSISVAEASAAGQRSIERLTGVLLACSSQEDEIRLQELSPEQKTFDGAVTAARESATYDPQKAWNLFVELSNRNTWQVPSLVWSHSTETENLNLDPKIRLVPASIRRQWESAGRSAAEIEAAKKQAAREVQLVDAMRRAGVQFMAGSHGPDPFVYPGFSLHEELEWLVKGGFTTAQALQAATFNPAIFLVKLDQFGVVETGHVADLVLVEANPLDDIRNTRKIAGVVSHGKYYSRSELDRLLGQVEELAVNE